MLGLTARVVHLEECDSFLVGIVESACEFLRCKFSCHFFPFFSFSTPMLLANDFYCCRYLLGLRW
jgi:hypothetical protein